MSREIKPNFASHMSWMGKLGLRDKKKKKKKKKKKTVTEKVKKKNFFKCKNSERIYVSERVLNETSFGLKAAGFAYHTENMAFSRAQLKIVLSVLFARSFFPRVKLLVYQVSQEILFTTIPSYSSSSFFKLFSFFKKLYFIIILFHSFTVFFRLFGPRRRC